MAFYSIYQPTTPFTQAMFNFDASGFPNYRLTGLIRVSVSDGFATGPLSLGADSEVPWQPSNLSNIQDILGVFQQFANLNFATVVDYDTTATNSIANPLNVGAFDLSDINITFFRPANPDTLGESGLSTDGLLGYTGSRGDIFLNPYSAVYGGDLAFDEASKIKQVFMHELGHSLGLSHPFITNVLGNDVEFQDFSALVNVGFQKLGFSITNGADLDREYFTIMSYDDENQDPFLNAYTPMILDVIALQQGYGPGPGTTGAGNDLIEAGTIGYRTYFDTGGNDTIEGDLYDAGIYINLGTSVIGADHLVGVVMSAEDAAVTVLDGGNPESLRWLYGEFENANGSQAEDVLFGNDLNNKLVGRGGDDFMAGADGADTISGDDGSDNLFGGPGADAISGGDGNDHLYGQGPNGGSDGADMLNGGTGSDYLQGNAGDDTLDGGDGSDRINGGQGNDSIVGGFGNDSVNGNLGNDTIDGGADNDSLRGGQGNDFIIGGAGSDILSGDLGSDTLTSGSGSDIFQFSSQGSLIAAPDRITDFTDAGDRISVGYAVSAVLTGAAQASASAAATLAQQLFDGNLGNREVAAIGVGVDTYLFFSSNGGSAADSAIIVNGVSASAFSLADFV